MFRILFVCTGNICRSPMAEGMLRHWLERDLVSEVEVSSAGTYAQEGLPASAHAVSVMAEAGMDISEHVSRMLHRAIIEEADLVLAMEAGHLYEILRLSPGAEKKAHLLGGYGSPEEEVAVDLAVFDPIGGSEDDYRHSHAIIESHLRRAYPAIRAAVSEVARARRQKGIQDA